MTTQRPPGAAQDSGPPEGSQPTRKSPEEDERIRKEGEAESSGDTPLDPADEAFIDSTK